MAKPHFDDAGSSCHIHSSLWSPDGDARALMAGRRRAPHERRVPLVPRRADRDRPRVLAAVRPDRQQLQALPAGELGADRRSAGTSTTARSASASSATGSGMRVESRIPGADANTYHAFAATIAGGLYGIEPTDRPATRRTTATATRRPTCHASRRRSSRRSSCGATARSPRSASATTSTTTCCTTPRPSGWRSTRPSPTGSGAATSSGSRPVRSLSRCACPRRRQPGGGGSPSSG